MEGCGFAPRPEENVLDPESILKPSVLSNFNRSRGGEVGLMEVGTTLGGAPIDGATVGCGGLGA